VKHCRLVVQRQRKQKGEQLDLFDGDSVRIENGIYSAGVLQQCHPEVGVGLTLAIGWWFLTNK